MEQVKVNTCVSMVGGPLAKVAAQVGSDALLMILTRDAERRASLQGPNPR